MWFTLVKVRTWVRVRCKSRVQIRVRIKLGLRLGRVRVRISVSVSVGVRSGLGYPEGRGEELGLGFEEEGLLIWVRVILKPYSDTLVQRAPEGLGPPDFRYLISHFPEIKTRVRG